MTTTQLDRSDAISGARSALRCVACAGNRLTPFFEIDRIPVHVGILHQTREGALCAAAGAVSLYYCHDCGLVHNQKFDESLTQFVPGYEVGLQHSPVFRRFIQQVARRLVEKYDLRNKRVFEIGCGDGFFLHQLCEVGGNHGVGVDPTIAHQRHETLKAGSVRLIRDRFVERFVDEACDIVCCLSVFEDIAKPRMFLNRIHRMIGQNRNGSVYFEVFNAFRAFERGETWSIHYEQCNYFSRQSLCNLFERCEFEVLDSGTCFEGDQYLFVEAKPSSQPSRTGFPAGSDELPQVIADFAQKYWRTRNAWNQRLDTFREAGKRVVLWGSGGKGVSFLNALHTEEIIQYVAEINPDKHGKFIPGSGQQIVPVHDLAELQPDIIIITNSLYQQEMTQQARELGVQAEFLVA